MKNKTFNIILWILSIIGGTFVFGLCLLIATHINDDPYAPITFGMFLKYQLIVLPFIIAGVLFENYIKRK